MVIQPEFQFPATDHADLDQRLAALVEILRGNGWMTRRQLEQKGFHERELRALSQHQKTHKRALVFSYPGSPGYKAFHDVTLNEFLACTALKNQGEEMIDRYSLYMREYHRQHPPK